MYQRTNSLSLSADINLFLQIILIAVIVAALLKKPDVEEEEVDEVDKNWEMHPKPDEELLYDRPRKSKTDSNESYIKEPKPNRIRRSRG